jgi:hypothetical protein
MPLYLYSGHTLKTAQLVLKEYKKHLSQLKEIYPLYLEKLPTPLSKVQAFSFKKWSEVYDKGQSPKVISLLGKKPRSVIELSTVDLENSPLQVSILRFFIKKLGPGVLDLGDGTFVPFIEAEQELERWRSEGDFESFIHEEARPDPIQEQQDTRKNNITDEIMDFLEYLQDYERSQHQSLAFRDLLENSDPVTQTLVEYLVKIGPAGLDEIAENLGLDERVIVVKAQKLRSELEEIFAD